MNRKNAGTATVRPQWLCLSLPPSPLSTTPVPPYPPVNTDLAIPQETKS